MARFKYIKICFRREGNFTQKFFAETKFRSDIYENGKFIRVGDKKLAVLCDNLSVRYNADFDAEFVVSANCFAGYLNFTIWWLN